MYLHRLLRNYYEDPFPHSLLTRGKQIGAFPNSAFGVLPSGQHGRRLEQSVDWLQRGMASNLPAAVPVRKPKP